MQGAPLDKSDIEDIDPVLGIIALAAYGEEAAHGMEAGLAQEIKF